MAWRSTKVYLTRSLMSTQDVVDNQGQWTHTYDGFPPIGNNNHALAFSAALVAAGKLGAPADDPLVAKLYQETVGVHLVARVAAMARRWDEDTESRVAPRSRQAKEREGVVPDGFSDGFFGPVLKCALLPKAARDEMQGYYDRVRHVRSDSEAF